jgi:hypothetical protein
VSTHPDDRATPIRLAVAPDHSVWAVPSGRKGWLAHILILFADGSHFCGCERQKKGCWHAEAAREEEAAIFADEENLAEARIEEIKEAFLGWQMRDREQQEAAG